MKLYLSSYRIPDIKKFTDFVGKDAEAIRFGLVLNSKDYRDEEYRNEKLEELIKYFSGFGFIVEEIDLRNFSDSNKLQEKLMELDVVWMNGGNTYMLRYILSKSGCDSVLSNVLESGVVYGGDSAGAVVAGSTLKYYSGADDPAVVDNAIYEGLGLVDFSVLPHWGSAEYAPVLEKIESSLSADGIKTIRLTDEEFILVENGKILDQ
jgi:dipeptidase E